MSLHQAKCYRVRAQSFLDFCFIENFIDMGYNIDTGQKSIFQELESAKKVNTDFGTVYIIILCIAILVQSYFDDI